jgi:hypothetical protein
MAAPAGMPVCGKQFFALGVTVSLLKSLRIRRIFRKFL